MIIQSIFKSEKEKGKLERLHIPNSKKYVDFMNSRQLGFMYNGSSSKKEEKLNKDQYDNYNSFKTMQNLIAMYCDRHLEYADELENLKRNNKSHEIKEFNWSKNTVKFVGFFINPEELFVNIFRDPNLSKDNSGGSDNNLLNSFQTNTENDLTSNYEVINPEFNIIKSIDNDDINLTSFLSSICFVDMLTDISERMSAVPVDDQLGFLRKQLHAINKTLPANIYIPFVKNSIRNYIICHMPVTELRIFRTKNRAPFLITFEVIRLDEVIE